MMMDNSDELMIKIDAVFSLSSSLDDEIYKDKEDISPSEIFANEANPMDSGRHDDRDEKDVKEQNDGCFINRASSKEPDSSRPSLRDDKWCDEAIITDIGVKDDACPVTGTAIGDSGPNESDGMDDVENQIILDASEVLDKETTVIEQVDDTQEDLNDGHEIIAEWTVDSDEEEALLNERDKRFTDILKDTAENAFKSYEMGSESQENKSSGNLIRFSSNEQTDARSSDNIVTENHPSKTRARKQKSTSYLRHECYSQTVENNVSEQKLDGTVSKITTDANFSDDCKHPNDALSFVDTFYGEKSSIGGTEKFQMRSLLTGKRVDVSYAVDLPPEREESIFTVIKPCFIVLNRMTKNIYDGGVEPSTNLTMRKRKSKCSNFCRKMFLNRKFKTSCRPSTCKMTCIRKGGSVILKYRTSMASESSEHACSVNESKFPKIITKQNNIQSETNLVPAEAHFPPNIRSSRKRKPTSLFDDNFILGDIIMKRKKFPSIKAESSTDAESNIDSVTDRVKCMKQEAKTPGTSCSKDIQKEAESKVKKEAMVQSFNSIKVAKGDKKRKKTKFEIEIDNPEAHAAVMISHGETDNSDQRQTTQVDLTGESKIRELLTGIGHRAEDVKFLNLEGGLICGFVPSPDGTSIYVSKRKKTKTPAELIASIKFKPNTTTKLTNNDMTNYCAQFVKTILSPKLTGRPLKDEVFKNQAKVKAACVSIADADPAKPNKNLDPKDTVHLFIPENQPSESVAQSDLQNAASAGHQTNAPTEKKHQNASSVVKLEQKNVLSNILSQTNISFDKTSTTIPSSQQNCIVYTTKSPTISTGSHGCSKGTLMAVSSTVGNKPAVSDTTSFLSGNMTSLASILKDPKSSVYTVPSETTPRVLKSILSSKIKEKQQKVSQSTQCYIVPPEKRATSPQKESDTIFKVIDNKTVIKYIKSKDDNEGHIGQSLQNDGDSKEKTFSVNKPVAAVRPIATCSSENPSAVVQGSSVTVSRNGPEVGNITTEPNVVKLPGIVESRRSPVSDFGQTELVTFGQTELVTAILTNQLRGSDMHVNRQEGVSNYLSGEPLSQQLAGNNQMSGNISLGSLGPGKQFGNVIAAVSKAEGVFKGPGKRTFYLLNVDGKNVLIPMQDNIVQPRAYVVSGNLSAEKASDKAELIFNSVESGTLLSSTVEKEANNTQSLLEKQSLHIAETTNGEIEKHAAECLKVAMGGLRILKPKSATGNSNVKDKVCDSMGTETLSKNDFETSAEGEANNQVVLNSGGTLEESTEKKTGNEKSRLSELMTSVSDPVVIPLTRQERLKQLREKLRQQEEALEQLRKQRMVSVIDTQS
ncbi:hypothetical protein ACJMK2_021444 [Sinanodonta woodiana]|uniref:Uncharacterized protein n=1 Tax=Sinanodonta woodiana TaxID=1069815 RepID=A0ABD3TG37_SINWO